MRDLNDVDRPNQALASKMRMLSTQLEKRMVDLAGLQAFVRSAALPLMTESHRYRTEMEPLLQALENACRKEPGAELRSIFQDLKDLNSLDDTTATRAYLRTKATT